MKPEFDITVLIVAYKSRDTIRRCLAALEQQSCVPARVKLLENGSPREERMVADELPDWVEFVSSEENLGFAGGNNLLAEDVETDWLVLLNPDAFPHDNWLEAFERARERYPNVRMFGSTQLVAESQNLLDGVGDVYHASGLAYRAGYGRPVSLWPPDGEVFGACGAGAFIRTDFFHQLGGFDENLFCYNEDVDLAFRARLAGYPTVQLSEAVVDHVGYASSARRSDFALYHGVRNRFWVFVKNMPSYLFWTLLPFHLFATACLWLVAVKNGEGKIFSRAIIDAVKGLRKVWRQRQDVQGGRKASVSEIAAAMCWDSRMLLTRSPDVRPYSPS